MALTEAALMRLVRFPAVRRAISLGLERATPEKVSVPPMVRSSVSGLKIRARTIPPCSRPSTSGSAARSPSLGHAATR